MRPRHFPVLLLAATMGAGGCYRWLAIKPTELPKLNGGAVTAGVVASGTNRGEVIAVGVGHVEAPDGRIVEIKGEFDARVLHRGVGSLTFTHPVRATLTGSDLTVQGGNRGLMQLPIAKVDKVEVSQPNMPVQILLLVALSAAAGLAIAALTLP